MHAYRPGHGSARTRVLYVFHSPSNVKVGRRALEPEVMEALEHTHPDLTFDWTTLLRDPAVRVEHEPAVRPGQPGANRPRPAPDPAASASIEIQDESTLGRVLGGREAARLRAHYNDLLQRIARRARTPEERDRLTERATRLNPDDWTDASAVQAAVTSIEADWEAIASELPQRRRGRRGGRSARRHDPEGPGRVPVAALPAEGPGQTSEARFGPQPESRVPAEGAASGIITGEGDPNEDSEHVFQTRDTGESSGASDAGHGRGLRPDAEPATDPDQDPN